MRLPTTREKRPPRPGCVPRPFTVSLVVNALLAAFLAYSFISQARLPGIDEGGGRGSEIQLQDLKVELSNVSAALQASRQALEEREGRAEADDLEAKKQQKALMENLQAMRSERDSLADLNTKLEKQKERPIGVDASGKYWLVIGIPTVPRRNDTDYLSRTLSSLLEELPLDPTDVLYARVRVIVMNNRPGNHTTWSKIRELVEGSSDVSEDPFIRKAKLYLHFVENPGTVVDPAPDAKEPDDENNPKNIPGRQVRRQTCDLISLLELAEPLSHYYMFLEDDFRVCPYMLRMLSYAVRKLNTVAAYKNWLALRFSYGMNGILLHNDDLPVLTAYLRKHTARLPPDLLWTEWYTGRRPELRKVTRGRKLAVYRYNLLDHIGARSSFAVRAHRPDWPRCYHPMADMWSLAKSEQFNEMLCPNSDIFPCLAGDGGEVWTKYPLQWPNVTEGTEADHLDPDMLGVEEAAAVAGPAASLTSVVGGLQFGEKDISLSGSS